MIYIFLADGFEDMEAIVPMDVLKRTGLDIKLVGVTGRDVVSCCGVRMSTDITVDTIIIEGLQAIVLPGGMPGTNNLNACKEIHDIVNYCVQSNILIGAICAAPIILGGMGLLNNKKACCFPGFESYLSGALISKDSVCKSGNIITAKGPGVAMDFALELVKSLCGEEYMVSLRKSMQMKLI